MKDFVTKKAISVLNFIAIKKMKFENDERGVSPVVATVLLILICVAIAILFKDKLTEWFNKLWEKVITQSDSI